MICERCGNTTSSAICTSCGYINSEQAEGRIPYEGPEQLPFGKKHTSIRLVRKWRWTRPLGYLDTVATALYISLIVFIALSIFIGACVFSIISIATRTPLPPFFFTITMVIIVVGVMVMFFADFVTELTRNLAIIGLGKYMKKNNIDGLSAIDNKRNTKQDQLLKDACVVCKKPLWLILYYSRALADLEFNIALALWLGTTLTVCLVELDLARMAGDFSIAIMPMLITFLIALLLGINVLVPFAIYNRVMSLVYHDHVYKDFQ